MALKNDRLIRALRRQPVDATPVWLMRQAGRYLPEYREIRAQSKDFLTLCKTPKLACEVTLQPLRRFDLDAAILFSDILTIPDAMGLELYFEKEEGPRFKKKLVNAHDIETLSVPAIEKDLAYVTDAIRLVKHELADTVPLIGFSGSPWTLAVYMIEGGSSKNFTRIRKMLFEQPQLLCHLLEILTQAVTLYLQAQINAGVNAVMIFDTWGGILTSRDYQQFSLHYMSKIVGGIKASQQLKQQPPIILFTKNGGQWLEAIASSGCDAISIDWMIDIGIARQRVGNRVALQGNLDPAVLYASPQRIQEEVKFILDQYGLGPGHIFNLGHGIYPDVSPENVKIMVDFVHYLTKK